MKQPLFLIIMLVSCFVFCLISSYRLGGWDAMTAASCALGFVALTGTMVIDVIHQRTKK